MLLLTSIEALSYYASQQNGSAAERREAHFLSECFTFTHSGLVIFCPHIPFRPSVMDSMRPFFLYTFTLLSYTCLFLRTHCLTQYYAFCFLLKIIRQCRRSFKILTMSVSVAKSRSQHVSGKKDLRKCEVKKCGIEK